MYKHMQEIVLGRNGEHRVLWDIKNATNGHVALIGESGSGKSVLAQKLMLEFVKQGATILVLDQHETLCEDQIFEPIKNEFESYCNDIYAYQDGIPCKLFEPIKYADGTVETNDVAASAITDVISRTFKLRTELKASLRLVIRKMIEEGTYKSRGIFALQEALINCGTKKTSELVERLYCMFEHNVFVDGDDMLLPGKINVVHMSRLSLMAQETVTELLLSYIWRLGNAEIFKKENFFCFIDECQNVESGSKSPLALLISEGRRMGINLILATQMILHGTTNAVQQRIAQCGLILFFRPASNRIALTAKMINLNDKDRWTIILNGLKIGEFVATGNLVVGNQQICYPLKVNAYEGKKYEPCESDSDKTKILAVNGASER
ncbi:ATP-binding protein [Eubacterium ramulus]